MTDACGNVREVAGAFCDFDTSAPEVMGRSVVAVTAARQDGTADRAPPAIKRAFWSSQLVDRGVLRAWIVSISRRNSSEPVAHLTCELYIGQRNIGLASDDKCKMLLVKVVRAVAPV